MEQIGPSGGFLRQNQEKSHLDYVLLSTFDFLIGRIPPFGG